MTRICIRILMVGVLSWGCLVGSIQASDGAASFVERSMEAQSVGRGNAVIASAQDVDAVAWNPAQLATIQTWVVATSVHRALETDFMAAGISGRWLGVPLGFRVQTAQLSGISQVGYDASLGRYAENGSTMAYSGRVFSLGSGITLGKDVRVGVALKSVQEVAGGYQAQGVGADVGVTAKVTSEIFVAGVISNLVQPQLKWNTPSGNVDFMRQKWVVGTQWKPFTTLALGMDWVGSQTSSVLNVGFEWRAHSWVPIRGGLAGGRLTLGTGLNTEYFDLDIAWIAPILDETEDMYRLSLRWRP